MTKILFITPREIERYFDDFNGAALEGFEIEAFRIEDTETFHRACSAILACARRYAHALYTPVIHRIEGTDIRLLECTYRAPNGAHIEFSYSSYTGRGAFVYSEGGEAMKVSVADCEAIDFARMMIEG